MSVETFSELTQIEKCNCIERLFKEYWPFATECAPIEKRVLITKFNSKLKGLVHDENCIFHLNIENLIKANVDGFKQSTDEEIQAIILKQQAQLVDKNNKLVNIHSRSKEAMELNEWNTYFYKMYYPSFYALGQEIKAYKALLTERNPPNILEPPKTDQGLTSKQWAIVYYYAFEKIRLEAGNTKKNRIEEFLKKHCLSFTYNSFKNTTNAMYKKHNTLTNEANNSDGMMFSLSVAVRNLVADIDGAIPILRKEYQSTLSAAIEDKKVLLGESID